MDPTILAAIDHCIRNRIPFIAYSLPGNHETAFFADPDGHECTNDYGADISMFGHNAPTVHIHAGYTAEALLHHTSFIPAKAAPLIRPYAHSTTLQEHRMAVNTIVDHLRNDGGKTVLSRTIAGTRTTDDWRPAIANLFACSPFAFRFVYYTHPTGFWLGASPELLGMADQSGRFTTMALAGTRTGNEPWDNKNLEEHQMVVDYIVDTLASFGIASHIGELETVACGPVQHLRHIITAQLTDAHSFNHVIRLLSPTPALAGYPLDKALADIDALELHPRLCYGGYISLSLPDGTQCAYVNLRSCHFYGKEYCIYSGGGITSHSDPEAEWEETQAKASSLLSVIG